MSMELIATPTISLVSTDTDKDKSNNLTLSPVISVTPTPSVYPYPSYSYPRRHIIYPDIYQSSVNQSSLARRQIADDLRYKFLDDWLWDESAYLLKYLKVAGDHVTVVKNMEEVKRNNVTKDSESTIEHKVDYIGDLFLTSGKVVKLLNALSLETGVEYTLLPYYQDSVRRSMENFVRDRLEKKIKYNMD